MRTLTDCEKSFERILTVLPLRLSQVLAALPLQIRRDTYEIRLRREKPLLLTGAYGICFPYGQGCFSKISYDKTPVVTAQEMQEIFYRLCEGSVYAHQQQLNEGYLTYGGYRVGVAGTAVHEGAAIKSVREITSLNLRLTKELPEAGKKIADKIFAHGLCSAALFGAPMTGKTTVLCSLASILSSEPYFYRTVLADEREELSGARGVNLDILRSYRKEEAIERATRALSPQLIICDELGNEGECESLLKSINNGVRFLVSVHCADKQEFLHRRLCRRLVSSECFAWFVQLPGVGEAPVFYHGEELLYEMARSHADFSGSGRNREVLSFQADSSYRPA